MNIIVRLVEEKTKIIKKKQKTNKLFLLSALQDFLVSHYIVSFDFKVLQSNCLKILEN